MTRSENFILDFTHIYIDENIEQTENIVRIDCSDILETDLYCTKEGEAEIQKRIENFSINGVHFIDSGNYHYKSFRLFCMTITQICKSLWLKE